MEEDPANKDVLSELSQNYCLKGTWDPEGTIFWFGVPLFSKSSLFLKKLLVNVLNSKYFLTTKDRC